MTALTWLGHAAFRLDTPAGDRIYIDPWLNGNPSCPAGELEPERVDAILVTIGLDMANALNKGGGADLLGSRVTMTHANHSSSYNGTYTGESCGFVIETPGAPTIYVAGDTNAFGDMQLIGRIYAPDVAILPIGDHFTMGPREAAVAAELVDAKRVVPAHYGTFP